MKPDEIKVRNEIYVMQNKEFVDNLIGIEDGIIDTANGFLGGIEIPELAYTLEDRLDELFCLFISHGELLASKLTPIVITQYFLEKFKLVMQSADNLVSKYIDARERNDEMAAKEVLNSKWSYEKNWKEISDELKNCDFYTLLDRIVESNPKTVSNINGEQAEKVCFLELKSANYQPKKNVERVIN